MIKNVNFLPSAKFNKDACIIFITEEQVKKKSFSFSNVELKNEILKISQLNHFKGSNGQTFPLLFNKNFILLVALGKSSDLTPTALRILVRKSLLSCRLNEVKDIEIVPPDQDVSTIKAVIEGAMLGTYSWKKYKTKPEDDKTIDEKNIYIAAAKKKEYEKFVTVCQGTNLARDLINENAEIVTSSYFEKTIKDIIKDNENISIEILNKKDLKSRGLNLHLAVNQGSNKEPKLIIVKYNGATKKQGYTAILGKGLTFDSGGLNLKISGHIETMRQDMSGAAAVVGILRNAVSLKIKKNIIFACALAENAIGANAQKPGDVIKGYCGKTVEIANTDAEGRLVLADAISYLVKNYKPAKIIDIATLTGACVVALGNDYTGLVTTDDVLSEKIEASSKETDDRVWRMPIYSELKDSVKSKIADIRNLGYPKGAGGTITAAEFLRQFTDNTKWAHLDIAGTAFVDNASRMYFGHGATGASVRLLTHYLMNN